MHILAMIKANIIDMLKLLGIILINSLCGRCLVLIHFILEIQIVKRIFSLKEMVRDWILIIEDENEFYGQCRILGCTAITTLLVVNWWESLNIDT